MPSILEEYLGSNSDWGSSSCSESSSDSHFRGMVAFAAKSLKLFREKEEEINY